MNCLINTTKHSHIHLACCWHTVKHTHTDALLWLVDTYLCGWPDRLLFYRWRWRPQSLHIWGWSESDRRLPRSHKPEASLRSMGTGLKKGMKWEKREVWRGEDMNPQVLNLNLRPWRWERRSRPRPPAAAAAGQNHQPADTWQERGATDRIQEGGERRFQPRNQAVFQSKS